MPGATFLDTLLRRLMYIEMSVTGGELDGMAVQTEIAKLSRVDWNWEALPQGDGSFLMVFPSEEEPLRMADIGYNLKSGITITISKWEMHGDVKPAYHLDEIWVHVIGVPHAWRHYLGFWAIGTMIGATLEVDMLTYRRKGVIRLLVGVMDKGQLPLRTDVVFHNVGYDITFTPEPQDFRPVISPQPTPNNGGDIGGNEDSEQRKEDADHTAKKQRSTSISSMSKTPSNGNQTTLMQVDSMAALSIEANPLLASLALTPLANGSSFSSKLGTPPLKQGTRPTQQTAPKKIRDSYFVASQTPTTQDMVSPQGVCNTTVVDVDGEQVTEEQPLRPSLNLQNIADGLNKPPRHERTESSSPRRPLSRAGGRVPDSISSQDAAAKGNAKPNAGMEDEPVLDKAMRRAAVRNLDAEVGRRERTLSSEGLYMAPPSKAMDSGHFYCSPLASHMGCATEAGYVQFFGNGYASFDSSGQGVFFPGAWLAV